MKIGITGKARAGKDTLGNYIKEIFKEKYNRVFYQGAFAYVLKLMCKEHFDLSTEQLWGDKKEHRAEFPRPGKTRFSSNPNDYWTAREIMQELGSFYRHIDVNFWVRALDKWLQEKESDDVIITDVRHLNELDYIKGCSLVNVRHGDDISLMSNDGEGFLINVTKQDDMEIHGMQHESETALDECDVYDVVIENNGSLEDLRKAAEGVVEIIVTIEKLREEES